MAGFSNTITLVASAATLAADTVTASPPSGWTFGAGGGPITSTVPAADWIVIEFSLGASVGLWVVSSGLYVGSGNAGSGVTVLTTANAGAADALFLPPGQSQPTTISNIQPQPNWNIKSGVITEYSLYAKDGSQSMSIGLTAQSGFQGTHSNSHWQFGPNFLAFVPTASATGSVTVTFQ